MSAEAWMALGTWVAVLIAIGAAVVAWLQVREARDLRREQAQPQVVAFMETNPNSPQIVEFVIRNFGVTPARNIRVDVEPLLRRTDEHGGAQAVWLPDHIPTLVPGQEWRTIWDVAGERLDSTELASEDRHEIRVSFDGVKGTTRQTTVSVLDWAAYKGRIYMDVKTTHHAASALRAIERTLKKWTDSPRGGLAVLTRDGDAADERRAEESEKRRAQYEKVDARLKHGKSGQPENPSDT